MPTLAELETKYFPIDPTIVPHSQDTEVIAHIDGAAYFAALAAAINATTGAGDVIYMANWAFDSDMPFPDATSTRTIKEILAQKAVDGVNVKLVLATGRNQLPAANASFTDPEYWGGFLPEKFRITNVVSGNMQSSHDMRNCLPTFSKPLQFSVLRDWSSSTVSGSRHQKYALVYSKSRQQMTAFVGGLDISLDRLDTPDHPDPDSTWHDVGAELKGEVARSVWVDFMHRWNETLSLPVSLYFSTLTKTRAVFNPPGFSPIAGPGSAVTVPVTIPTNSVRVVRSYGEEKDALGSIAWDDPSLGSSPTQILKVFTQAINNAQRYIYVEDQSLNDANPPVPHGLLYPLIGNAVKRGVMVLFVTSGNGPDFVYSATLLNELGLSNAWLPNSVPKEFKMVRVDNVYIHSKVVLIDDEFAAIGSANFFDRSMEGVDTELTAAIVDSGTWVRDLRVKLMAEHFRVDPNSPAHKAALENVDHAFGLFGMATANPVTFTRPDSRLYIVGETLPSTKV